MKDHVIGLVDDFGIRVASGIIEEVYGGIVGRLNICAEGNVFECTHHGIVDCSGIEEKFSGDLLEEFYFLWCEGHAVVNISTLDGLAVVGAVHFGWTVVCLFWNFMSKFF